MSWILHSLAKNQFVQGADATEKDGTVNGHKGVILVKFLLGNRPILLHKSVKYGIIIT